VATVECRRSVFREREQESLIWYSGSSAGIGGTASAANAIIGNAVGSNVNVVCF
jgi:hypothetical protein